MVAHADLAEHRPEVDGRALAEIVEVAVDPGSRRAPTNVAQVDEEGPCEEAGCKEEDSSQAENRSEEKDRKEARCKEEVACKKAGRQEEESRKEEDHKTGLIVRDSFPKKAREPCSLRLFYYYNSCKFESCS